METTCPQECVLTEITAYCPVRDHGGSFYSARSNGLSLKGHTEPMGHLGGHLLGQWSAVSGRSAVLAELSQLLQFM